MSKTLTHLFGRKLGLFSGSSSPAMPSRGATSYGVEDHCPHPLGLCYSVTLTTSSRPLWLGLCSHSGQKVSAPLKLFFHLQSYWASENKVIPSLHANTPPARVWEVTCIQTFGSDLFSPDTSSIVHCPSLLFSILQGPHRPLYLPYISES